MTRKILLRAALMTLAATSALASGPQFGRVGNVDRCYDAKLTPDETIAACQNVILSGVLDYQSAVGAYANMGAAYEKKGDYPHALEAFNYTIKWSPGMWQPYFNRANIYEHMGQFDDALADAGKVVQLQPRLADGYELRCRMRADEDKELDQALADCNQAVTLDAKSANAFIDRARVYLRMGSFPQSIADASNAISLKPSVARAYHVRAVAYGGAKQYENALADFAQALKLQPNESGILFDRAFLYGLMHQDDLEKQDLDHAIAISPKESYLMMRAGLYNFRGNHQGAVSDYTQVLSLNPQNVNALNGRCWNLATSGSNLDMALADCDKGVRLANKNADIIDSRGFVHFRMKDYPAAIADDNAALAINPKESGSLYIRGLAKLKSGDAEGGNADIAAAKAIDPKVADTYAGYGVTP